LTKQPVDEDVLKFHVTVEKPSKVGEGNNALVVCDAQVSHELEEKVMPELYNLEDCVEPAKPVKIDLDLDLYQMEKV
jgi:hypothetical protein